MRPLPIHPLGAAIIFALLAMGLLGVVVVLPIACIQFTWNSLSLAADWLSQSYHSSFSIPQINGFQAALLYLAFGLGLYLTGWVQIDISLDNAD